jgi:exonuclease VII large subunit
MLRIVENLSARIASISRCLTSSQFALLAISQKFDDKVERLLIAISNLLQRETLRLKARRAINLDSYLLIKEQTYKVIDYRFSRLLENYLVKHTEKVTSLSNRLEQASFKKILQKGFCFVSDEFGSIVETKEKFEKTKNQGLLLNFQDGAVDI